MNDWHLTSAAKYSQSGVRDHQQAASSTETPGVRKRITERSLSRDVRGVDRATREPRTNAFQQSYLETSFPYYCGTKFRIHGHVCLALRWAEPGRHPNSSILDVPPAVLITLKATAALSTWQLQDRNCPGCHMITKLDTATTWDHRVCLYQEQGSQL
jgi:hypothetical protein